MSGYQVEEFDQFESAARYQSDWNRLALDLGWPFAEFESMIQTCRHLEPEFRLSIFVILLQDRFHGGMVFSNRGNGLANALSPIGYSALAEPSLLLVRDSQALQAFIDYLVRRRRPFSLPRILNTEDCLARLKQSTRPYGIVMQRGASASAYLDLRLGEAGIMQQLSAKRRSNLRRKEKRLSDKGPISYDTIRPTLFEVESELADFENIEDRGWKGRNGSSIRKREGFHSFFLGLLQHFASSGRVRIDRLRLENRTIAIQLGIASQKQYFLLKLAYNESFARYSPGYHLTRYAINKRIEENLARYEFMGSMDEWKTHWTRDFHHARTFVFYPYSIKGLARFTRDAVVFFTSRFR